MADISTAFGYFPRYFPAIFNFSGNFHCVRFCCIALLRAYKHYKTAIHIQSWHRYRPLNTNYTRSQQRLYRKTKLTMENWMKFHKNACDEWTKSGNSAKTEIFYDLCVCDLYKSTMNRTVYCSIRPLEQRAPSMDDNRHFISINLSSTLVSSTAFTRFIIKATKSCKKSNKKNKKIQREIKTNGRCKVRYKYVGCGMFFYWLCNTNV